MTPTANPADGIVLLGVPALVLVPLIVAGLKRLGLPRRWAPAAAVLVAAGVAALAEAVQAWPALTPLARVVLAAVLIGFGARGATLHARQARRRVRARSRQRRGDHASPQP